MGVRNVARNARRSFITGAMIAIGVAAIVFFKGYISGLQELILQSVVESRTGALQVQRFGYGAAQDLAPLDLDLPTGAEIERQMHSVENVKDVAPRLRFVGLLSNGDASSTFIGLGIDPEKERVVCPLSPTGSPHGEGALSGNVTGPGFQGAGEDSVILASQLAIGLKLAVGDTVTLLAQTRAGSTDAVDVTVRGTISIPDPLQNKSVILVPLGLAQRLLHMPGRATAYAVSVRRRDAIDETVGPLSQALSGFQPKTEVHPWTDLEPYYRDVMTLQDEMLRIVTIILFTVALAGVINTMMMSVFERKREVGTLMALGFKRRAILSLFVVEALALGTVSAIVGAALGAVLIAISHHYGLPFPIPAVGTIMNHPIQNPGYAVFTIGVALVGVVVAGLYPAYRGSRLSPVEALRAD